MQQKHCFLDEHIFYALRGSIAFRICI